MVHITLFPTASGGWVTGSRLWCGCRPEYPESFSLPLDGCSAKEVAVGSVVMDSGRRLAESWHPAYPCNPRQWRLLPFDLSTLSQCSSLAVVKYWLKATKRIKRYIWFTLTGHSSLLREVHAEIWRQLAIPYSIASNQRIYSENEVQQEHRGMFIHRRLPTHSNR